MEIFKPEEYDTYIFDDIKNNVFIKNNILHLSQMMPLDRYFLNGIIRQTKPKKY